MDDPKGGAVPSETPGAPLEDDADATLAGARSESPLEESLSGVNGVTAGGAVTSDTESTADRQGASRDGAGDAPSEGVAAETEADFEGDVGATRGAAEEPSAEPAVDVADADAAAVDATVGVGDAASPTEERKEVERAGAEAAGGAAGECADGGADGGAAAVSGRCAAEAAAGEREADGDVMRREEREVVVKSLLRNGEVDAQRLAAQEFMVHELAEASARAHSTPAPQGPRQLQIKIKKVRYLASRVVEQPIDMATQVTTFMTGLQDVPAKTQLFREYPKTLEVAFAVALREDFNWPLPRELVEAIDAFFEARRKAGHVRESISPHSSPMFCVKKGTGGWRIALAYNKLNDATIPAQTPIPRKDMIFDGTSGSTVFPTIDPTDCFYQILMRESDLPLTAVSTPSGMLWKWLVMPQGLKNAPATFNRMVSHALRPFRSFAPSYFDDIFTHSKAEGYKSDVEVHLEHLEEVFCVMQDKKLYANLKKCIFFVPEILVLGCYAELVRSLSTLLKKDVEWVWTQEHQTALDAVKKSLQEAPVLALPDYSRPFHVVCDASDFAIGCALMHAQGAERVITYQSRQLKTAERNYPVHDKELLAM
ncbi:hypothetical protein ATCC90586_006365 [Pythium insidiosum]|nr:hypothetical protein ATCC90586_006365 [Pythium insidiosum]